MAVEINNPADFPFRLGTKEATDLISIQPIPLQPALMRERLLESAILLTIAQFPRDEGHKAECLEFAVGMRVTLEACKGKLVLQFS